MKGMGWGEVVFFLFSFFFFFFFFFFFNSDFGSVYIGGDCFLTFC